MYVCVCINVDILNALGGFGDMWVSGWASLFEVGIDPTIKATNNLHMGDAADGKTKKPERKESRV